MKKPKLCPKTLRWLAMEFDKQEKEAEVMIERCTKHYGRGSDQLVSVWRKKARDSRHWRFRLRNLATRAEG